MKPVYADPCGTGGCRSWSLSWRLCELKTIEIYRNLLQIYADVLFELLSSMSIRQYHRNLVFDASGTEAWCSAWETTRDVQKCNFLSQTHWGLLAIVPSPWSFLMLHRMAALARVWTRPQRGYKMPSTPLQRRRCILRLCPADGTTVTEQTPTSTGSQFLHLESCWVARIKLTAKHPSYILLTEIRCWKAHTQIKLISGS